MNVTGCGISAKREFRARKEFSIQVDGAHSKLRQFHDYFTSTNKSGVSDNRHWAAKFQHVTFEDPQSAVRNETANVSTDRLGTVDSDYSTLCRTKLV